MGGFHHSNNPITNCTLCWFIFKQYFHLILCLLLLLNHNKFLIKTMNSPRLSLKHTVKKKLLRNCPCCKKRVIQPLDFKKFEPYSCPHCSTIVGVLVISVIGFIMTLLLIQQIFYKLDYVAVGHIVLIMLFFYWCFSTKIDAMLLPLIEVQD
jgi:hypothetical protein